jgi:hypothetical protein
MGPGRTMLASNFRRQNFVEFTLFDGEYRLTVERIGEVKK